MGERKGVNKYYPPDWDPRKGSVNKRVGQHPLRDRARKLSQGILVIRFELPYNIWCGGCGSHVGMGVRYNAEKSKVGNYYSTPIYKFRMKCHLCDNYFEIQTDPKNHDYVILSGARRKEQRWDPVANGQVVPEDKATQKKLATDPMYKLEHGSDDAQKGKDKVMSLAQIEECRWSMKDDYILNRMARDQFRTEKKRLKELAEADQAILDKSSLDIDLVEESEEDKKLAGLMKYSVTTSYEDKQKEIRKSIELRPIFKTDDEQGTPSTSSSTSSSSSSGLSPYQKHKVSSSGREGQTKQKLKIALKASRKDPFNAQKSLISTQQSAASQALLGIKLKAPTQTTHKNRNSTTVDDSSLMKTYNLSPSSIREKTTPDEIGIEMATGTHGSNYEHGDGSNYLGNITSSPELELPDTNVCHSDLISKKSFACEQNISEGPSNHEKEDNSDVTTDLETPQNSSISASGVEVTPSNCDSNKEQSFVDSRITDSNLPISSGLTCLMTSYSDSDSNSSA